MLLVLLLFCQYKADFLQLSKSSPKKHWGPRRGAISTLTLRNTLPLMCFGSEVRFLQHLVRGFQLSRSQTWGRKQKALGCTSSFSPRHCLALAVFTLATWQAYWVLFLSRWLWPQSLTMSVSCLFLNSGDERGLLCSTSPGSHCPLGPLNSSSSSVTSFLGVECFQVELRHWPRSRYSAKTIAAIPLLKTIGGGIWIAKIGKESIQSIYKHSPVTDEETKAQDKGMLFPRYYNRETLQHAGPCKQHSCKSWEFRLHVTENRYFCSEHSLSKYKHISNALWM